MTGKKSGKDKQAAAAEKTDDRWRWKSRERRLHAVKKSVEKKESEA